MSNDVYIYTTNDTHAAHYADKYPHAVDCNGTHKLAPFNNRLFAAEKEYCNAKGLEFESTLSASEIIASIESNEDLVIFTHLDNVRDVQSHFNVEEIGE